MPLSALEKTWQFDVNNAIGATGTNLTTMRNLWLSIKNALIGFGTLPWTVRYSCDSVVAGAANDLVDRWDTNTDLTWATQDTGTAARSWIVLRNTDGVEILLECRNSSSSGNGRALRIVMSPAAHFTGGTTLARPTATDEVVIVNGDSATASCMGGGNGGGTTDGAWAHHVLHSTDGLVTMVIVCRNGFATGFWYIGRLSLPVTGFTFPVVGCAWGGSTTTFATEGGSTIANMLEGVDSNVTNPHAAFRHSGTNGRLFAVSEAFGDGSLSASSSEPIGRNLVVANEISGQYQLPQVGMASLTSGLRGEHGRLFDVVWVPEVRASAEHYPDDGSRARAVFGDILVPWDGSAAIAA